MGGTSLGAPAWSALIAIADGMRVDAGGTTLNGAGQTLPAGSYEVAWEGLGPAAQVSILKRGKPVANAHATVAAMGKDAPANDTAWRTNPDGSFSLDLLQFKGRNFALRFDP